MKTIYSVLLVAMIIMMCLPCASLAIPQYFASQTKVLKNSTGGRKPAQSRRKRRRRYKKRVTVDFGDESLEGSISSPGIFHLFHKKELNYGRLIKFRKNFLPEMRRTAREI